MVEFGRFGLLASDRRIKLRGRAFARVAGLMRRGLWSRDRPRAAVRLASPLRLRQGPGLVQAPTLAPVPISGLNCPQDAGRLPCKVAHDPVIVRL